MSLIDISKSLLKSNKIGITYHASPDGDAVGSALGLLAGLRSLNKNAYLISKDKLSDNLYFLPLSEEVTGEIEEPLEGTDTVIVLDCGNYERVSANLKGFRGKLINVDHHISNDYYGDENFVDAKAAATAEIVYDLLEYLGVNFDEDTISNKQIGTCLYTSLVTDTGAFRHSNVREKTHTIAAKLKKLGVDNTYIYQSLFDNKSFQKIRLIGKALDKMELLLDRKVALIQLPMCYAEELGIELGDTSDIISFGLQIKGVEVSVLIKETENGSKASLRSKTNFDVRAVAENLGGGGHTKASGITLKGICMDEAKDRILEQIEMELR